MVEAQTVRVEIRTIDLTRLVFAGDLTVYPWHRAERSWDVWLEPVTREWLGRVMQDPAGEYAAVALDADNGLTKLAEITVKEPSA